MLEGAGVEASTAVVVPLASRAPAPAGSECAAEEAEEDGAGMLVSTGVESSAVAAVPPSSRAPAPAGSARAAEKAEEDGAGVLVGAAVDASAAALAPLAAAAAAVGDGVAVGLEDRAGAWVAEGVGVGVGLTGAVRAAAWAAALLGEGVALLRTGVGAAGSARGAKGDPGPPGVPEAGPLLLPLLTPAQRAALSLCVFVLERQARCAAGGWRQEAEGMRGQTREKNSTHQL